MTEDKRLTALFSVLPPLLMAAPAHAYLDAGSASTVFQALMGAAAAALLLLKVEWYRVKAFLGGGEPNSETDEQRSAE